MNPCLRYVTIGAASVLIAMVVAACQAAAPRGADASPPRPAHRSAPEAFRALGQTAPLTVYPTELAGKSSPQVGEVVAMMLERAGMTELETTDTSFRPPENAGLAATAAAFAAFVRANPPTTEYAMFTGFLGSPEAGFTELRTAIVDRSGETIWQDRLAKGDPEFDRVKPKEPLQLCLLTAERLRPVLGLSDPASSRAKPGRITQRWQQRTGVPDKAGLDAIRDRGEVFRKAASGATMIVYPVHAGHVYSEQSAQAIAAALKDQKLTLASATDRGPRPQTPGNMNEQKVLWAMARGISDHVRQNPPDADYALFAQYLMGTDAVGAVHFVVCDRRGELVVVDFQNSHHAEFKAIHPKTREDCDRLVIRRMNGLCK